MVRGVNKVILIGTLGDEPVCRTTGTGIKVANLSMVTNERRRNADGEYSDYAEWHRVVLWNRLAEIGQQYLHKGSQVYIEGKLHTNSYTDQQGQKRSTVEIVADEMQMLGGPRAQSTDNSTYQQRPASNYNGQTQANPRTGNGYGGGNAQSGAYGGYGAQPNAGYGSQTPAGYGNSSVNAQQNMNAPQPMRKEAVPPATVVNNDPDSDFIDDELPF